MMKLLAVKMLSTLLLHPATPGCTLITSYPDGKPLYEQGDCDTRRSPASTFKIPLAVMGYDSGILKDEHTPSLPYKDEYNGYENQRKTTDPTIWERDSIVWYSQQLTQHLGMEKFQSYVDQFDYGNRDLSGHPSKNDGLTQAWLFTSLAISPKEETIFLTRLLSHHLGVSDRACAMTMTILPTFKAGDWTVHGKTGSGQIDGDKNKPQGWFVGWAENGKQKIVFAKMILPAEAMDAAGPKARDEFLSELPSIISK